MPARVRSERTSLSNCANAASTPSISLPVDVSSIGSVADRSEMPSDCRCERSAKWSYLSRAKRVRLNTTTKWSLPLCVRQNVQHPAQLGAVRGLRALALFLEAREDLEPFAAAVLLAGTELGRQAQVLGLFLGADADVDDGAGHGSELSPDVGTRQGEHRDDLQSRVKVAASRDLDHQVSHRLGMAADLVDLVIGQPLGLVAEQFSAPRDRNRLRDVVHARSGRPWSLRTIT